MERITCCNTNISYCIWTEKQKVPLFCPNSPLQFSVFSLTVLFRLHCARRNCHWMPPCTHYKAVPIGRQQKAEIKVHSYSGWTTSRTDIMGSDWKQTFTDLNGTEVRNMVESTAGQAFTTVHRAGLVLRLYKAVQGRGEKGMLSSHACGWISSQYRGVLLT